MTSLLEEGSTHVTLSKIIQHDSLNKGHRLTFIDKKGLVLAFNETSPHASVSLGHLYKLSLTDTELPEKFKELKNEPKPPSDLDLALYQAWELAGLRHGKRLVFFQENGLFKAQILPPEGKALLTVSTSSEKDLYSALLRGIAYEWKAEVV